MAEAEADDELENIYSRIRELESSIVTLGEIMGLLSSLQYYLCCC